MLLTKFSKICSKQQKKFRMQSTSFIKICELLEQKEDIISCYQKIAIIFKTLLQVTNIKLSTNSINFSKKSELWILFPIAQFVCYSKLPVILCMCYRKITIHNSIFFSEMPTVIIQLEHWRIRQFFTAKELYTTRKQQYFLMLFCR